MYCEAKGPNLNAFITQPKRCGELWINTVFWKTSHNPRTNYLHYGLILKRYSSDSESNSDFFSIYNILVVSRLNHYPHLLVHSLNKYLNSYSVQTIVIDAGGITVKITA